MTRALVSKLSGYAVSPPAELDVAWAARGVALSRYYSHLTSVLEDQEASRSPVYCGQCISEAIAARQAMAKQKPSLLKELRPIQRYGLAVASVTIAIGTGLLLQRYSLRGVESILFLLAIALTVWFGGGGPAILAVVLSSLFFNYFFTEPLYSLYIGSSELPYYLAFILFATLLTWFSTVRRRVERELLQSRDELQREVAERTQQANLLNLTHDTIFVRDISDMITYWNRGAQELYGWTEQQAIGNHSDQLLQTEFSIPIEKVRAELLRTGRWEGELRKTKADGSRVVVASRWSLQRDERGHPVAILETNNDVTDRKRREEEIRTLNHELGKRTTDLEASNKELEAFAYSVSHDLRAPIRHIAGYAELLQKNSSSALDEKSHRYMMTILESAKRMGTLIDDLLAFSRIGRAETRETTVNLDLLVKEALGEVQQDINGRNIVWKISALPDLYGDRSMLRLALINLISNAVKFTRTRPQAEIEIGCLEKKKDEVVVFIKDNGVGFDMKYVDKLFGVFRRLHSAQAFEGTGIGLATVQRIIHRHGGRVWAASSVDGGATFFLSVPSHRS
jgi:PAS domain S-box-containing protein